MPKKIGQKNRKQVVYTEEEKTIKYASRRYATEEERKKLFNDRQQEIEDIKRDVTDIKNILMKLVEDKNGNND